MILVNIYIYIILYLKDLPPGKPVLGQLVDDYLLDFDIFHVSHVTELLHYIEPKYLSGEATTNTHSYKLAIQGKTNLGIC